jgi:hypothetical protein
LFERFPLDATELYNRSCFIFAHHLHDLPIFDVENLVDVSTRLREAHYENGKVAVDAGWGAARAGRPSLQETLATIGDSNSLVLLKGVAHDPEFAPVFRQIVEGLMDYFGPALRDDVSESRATLIVSSPHQVTPYHIDAETNFLFQVRGTKIVNVFDPGDRGVLTDVELERFYAGDFNAAAYKPDRQDDAAVFTFAPGDGLHIPIQAPHWVQNGDAVSVAISVNFSLHSNRRMAQLYKFNHLVRKSGLSPAPPGSLLWRDRLKLVAAGGLDYARRRRRRFTSMNDDG